MGDEKFKLHVDPIDTVHVDTSSTHRTNGSSRTVGASRPDNYTYDPDQWYLDLIAQYSSDPELYQYLLANPHLVRNSGTYVPQWYEQLLGTTDTNEQRYLNQLRSEANSWLADALAQKHIENYTDPAQETARRRAAGINDDLSGGSQIGSGEPANPSPEDTDTNLPYAMSDAANEEAKGVISSVMSLFELGLNAAQSFQSLNAGEISLLNGEIKNFSDFNSIVGSTLAQNLSPDELKAIVTGTDTDGQALSKAMNWIYSDHFLNKLSPRLRRRFAKFSHRGRGNDAFTTNQLQSILKSYTSDRYDLASTLGHPFYKDDFTEMMATIGKYVNDYQIEYDKLWKDFDFDKLGIVDKETGMSLGEMEGQAALAGKKYDALRAQSDKMTERLWNNIIHALTEKDTWWSNLLLFFVPFVRSMAENARMPSVGLSASVRNGVHDTKDVYMH